jgi:hypothetical protein
MAPENLKDYIESLRRNLRITKIVATRSVKTKSGDFFAGISSAFDSRQEEGHAADLDLVMSAAEVSESGMSLIDARVSHVMLSVEASIAAWRAAYIDGAISEGEFEARCKHVKQRGSKQISELVKSIPALNSSPEVLKAA